MCIFYGMYDCPSASEIILKDMCEWISHIQNQLMRYLQENQAKPNNVDI